MKTYEIGEMITWTVGNVESKGAVLEDNGTTVTVITHFIGGIRSNRKIEVEKVIINE